MRPGEVVAIRAKLPLRAGRALHIVPGGGGVAGSARTMAIEDVDIGGGAAGLVGALCAAPPRAGAFIVTLYGDVVDPRGGTVWIGNLIETCSAVGINESLVRTAVSRLVASGQLTGERDGRRSFYSLTPAARSEYAAAAAALYRAEPPPAFVLAVLERDGEGAMAWLERQGFARLSQLAAMGGRPPSGTVPGIVFAARPDAGDLRAFAAAHWDLAAHAAAYAEFLALVDPLDGALADVPAADCLTLRLLLVHHFRKVLLADPRLPAEALPEAWIGEAAHRRFGQLYTALSAKADRLIGATFVGPAGAFAHTTPETAARLSSLTGATAR